MNTSLEAQVTLRDKVSGAKFERDRFDGAKRKVHTPSLVIWNFYKAVLSSTRQKERQEEQGIEVY